MTVSYSREVFTSTGTGIFLRLLGRWKGSIYKLVWRDLLVYVSIYTALSLLYRFQLSEEARERFEKISVHCGHFADLIPVTFVLGFYVSIVITRWWQQFESIPWPDSPSLWITNCINGHDERGRLMRRTIMRYINLSLILTLRLICLPVKKRFPHYDHLVEAGILEKGEKKIMEVMDEKASHPKYWMPLVWAGAIVTRARKEKRINSDYDAVKLMEKLDQFRANTGGLLNYDWVTVPLVYTQVVTLAVYTFLLSTLMGRQFLDPTKKIKGHEADLVVPVFTFLQFFFYMGWLKVAEALINPFGEDDDDFEMNWVIDRNFQVSYLIVDEMHSEHPDLIKDQFWDDLYPEIPYTAAAEEKRGPDPVIGAAANIEVPENEAEFLPIYDDNMDRHSLIRSNAALSEVVIDVNGKSSRYTSPKKCNKRKGSFENIRQSPLGPKMRNVQSDVAFFVGCDSMDNNVETLIEDNDTKHNNSVANSNNSNGNYHGNIINFSSPTKLLKDKKIKKGSRFGSINNFDLGHSESAQAMSLLHHDATSTNTIAESCSSSKKSKHSSEKSTIKDLVSKFIRGGASYSNHQGIASNLVSRSHSRLGLGSNISLFSRNSNKRRKYRRPSRFSRGGSNRISRANSRVSTLSQRSSIVSDNTNKRDLMRETSKDDNDDFLSNASDEPDCNDDDDDGIFRLSHSHSSLSSLDSDMTGRTDGTRKIQKVVRDVIKRDFKSFGNKNFQSESPRVSHYEARSAAKKLLQHLKQGDSTHERQLSVPQHRIRVSATGSPAINSKDIHNSYQHSNTLADSQMELRIKLDVIQKLQAEIIQLIEIQDDKENKYLKTHDFESSQEHENHPQTDDAMKQLVDEHSNLLKKTLLLSARRRSASIDSKTPQRGELALDAHSSSSKHGTWSNFARMDEKEHSSYEKDDTSTPRFGGLNSKSGNLSKENINYGNISLVEASDIDSSNLNMISNSDGEKVNINVSNTNHLDASKDQPGLQSLMSTIIQPSTYQSTFAEGQGSRNEEKSESSNNDGYEPFAALKDENIYSPPQEVIKEDMIPINEIAEQLSAVVDVSETVQSVLNCVGKNNPMAINTSELATSIAADLNPDESAALQASVEAILVASATPEIHSQYELATIEEQPELGYQSDSSDTESMMMASGAKGKNLKRKSLVKVNSSTEGTAKPLENENKTLAPVLEDMMEENND